MLSCPGAPSLSPSAVVLLKKFICTFFAKPIVISKKIATFVVRWNCNGNDALA